MLKNCLFKDRFEAGKKLAEKLIKYTNIEKCVEESHQKVRRYLDDIN